MKEFYHDITSLNFVDVVNFGQYFGAVASPARELSMNNVRLIEINEDLFSADDMYPAALLHRANFDACM